MQFGQDICLAILKTFSKKLNESSGKYPRESNKS